MNGAAKYDKAAPRPAVTPSFGTMFRDDLSPSSAEKAWRMLFAC